MPQLHFVYDDSIESGIRMSQLIDDAIAADGRGIRRTAARPDVARRVRADPRRRIDGVLLLDKPTGLTSNGALMRVKRLYNAEKAGHTGTLDPLASGLLPICFGLATRFAQFLLDAPKRYVATVRFGVDDDDAGRGRGGRRERVR